MEVILWIIIIMIIVSLIYIIVADKSPVDQLISDAIFSDESPNFREPFQPTSQEDVRVWLRTARKNVDQVILHLDGAFQEMKIQRSDHYFDYYLGIIPQSETKTHYYFQVNRKNKTIYYTKEGIQHQPPTSAKDVLFTVIPNSNVPSWMVGGVFYQLDVDRFYNGNEKNDVVNKEYIYQGQYATKAESWYEYPSTSSQSEFYGGDLQGVKQKLHYLQSLGVDVISLSPIFISPSSHKDDTQNFLYVDPHYGEILSDGGQTVDDKDQSTVYAEKYMERVANKDNLKASNQLLSNLIEEIHQLGMKIILEGNFSYCSSFHAWLDEPGFYKKIDGIGAYYEQNSLYRDYFYWKNKKGWPNNLSYEKWKNKKEYAKLNYEGSSALYATMLQVGSKWVGMPHRADGWKVVKSRELGANATTRKHFWGHFRDQVKSTNPQAVIIAEGDHPKDFGKGGKWDSVTNMAGFLEPISYFLTGMSTTSNIFDQNRLGNAAAFIKEVEKQRLRFPDVSYWTAFNPISYRESSRFLTRTNQQLGNVNNRSQDTADTGINTQVYKQAVMMMMTWTGCPAIYYGDEAGVCGWAGTDSRRTYPWEREIDELIEYHKDLIKLRRRFPSLKKGSFLFLYGGLGVVAYARWLEEEVVVVVINRSLEDKIVQLPLWLAQVRNGHTMKEIMDIGSPVPVTIDTEETKLMVQKGMISIHMPGLGGKIFST